MLIALKESFASSGSRKAEVKAGQEGEGRGCGSGGRTSVLRGPVFVVSLEDQFWCVLEDDQLWCVLEENQFLVCVGPVLVCAGPVLVCVGGGPVLVLVVD